MRKIKTKGICAYCKTEIPKNSSSILNHLSKCEYFRESKDNKRTNYFILLLEGKYNPEYWIVIKAKPYISMKKIDKFLKDIWVECCGHLSEFHDGNSNIAMTRKINQVFEKGCKIDYIYDFGSSTELSLALIGELEYSAGKDIQILFRNKEIEFQCSYCDNKAVAICPFCIYGEEGLLCDSCIENHQCVQDEGEDVLLPIVNSPRLGECGYIGYLEKDVKKYFPKEIF